jgi:hypothetical protein
MKHFLHGRTLVAVVVTVLVCGATTAGAAKLITGADVKNGSLTGKDVKNGSLTGDDIKDGSLGKKELSNSVQNAIPTRVPGTLPSNGFYATNISVSNTPDGVEFGPYADGAAAGGSICTDTLNGQHLHLSEVQHIAYEARYTADGDTGGVGVPYLRIFLENDHDAIFSPNTQPPDSDVAEGPFHTWVATAGLWRYDDDAGAGGEYGVNGAPFSTVVGDHGTDVITSVCITTGFTSGTNLSALLRSWELNAKDYAFGL